MKNFNSVLYRDTGQKLIAAVQRHSAFLAQSELAAVEHYLNSDEYEMAYELFCLQLMRHNVRLEPQDCSALITLGSTLGLDQETVFEPDFWRSFQSYVNKQGIQLE